MHCHSCEAEAMAICSFCGRAVCRTCHKQMPNILTVFIGAEQLPKAIVVADAIWCGTCRPLPEPIPMPEIY